MLFHLALVLLQALLVLFSEILAIGDESMIEVVFKEALLADEFFTVFTKEIHNFIAVFLAFAFVFFEFLHFNGDLF
jgi:hypothetical protein